MPHPKTSRNPKGAGAPIACTTHKRQVTITGMSDELVELFDRVPNKSKLLRELIESYFIDFL
jgi:hypothetical protein